MKFNKEKAREFARKNITVIVTVIVMIFLLVFLYAPKISALSELKKEFEKKAEELRGKNELIDKLVEIGAAHQSAKVDIGRLHREHAGRHQIPEMLVSLTAASGDLNFELRAINRSPQEKEKFFVKVPLELKIESGYRSFAEYIDRITRIARLLDIRRIEISQEEDIYPRLKINLLLDAYFLENGGGAK